MSKHIDPMEPIFFTPPNQPRHPVGGRRLFKGGGGGGEREATAEEKRLWAAQADSLEKLTGIATPNLLTGMNNLGQMVNESNDGTLAAQLRTQASNDANVALGSSLNDMKRVGGFDPTLRGGQDAMAQFGLGAAKQRLGAMNLASMSAEDQKWQRNAALTGLASGQGAQAISGMSALSGQLANNRQMSNNMAMQQQNSQGQAVGGLLMGGKMMGLYKDGGPVGKKGQRFASGGLARFRKLDMPNIAPYTFQSDDSGEMPSGELPVIDKLAGSAMAANMAAGAMDKVGISAPKTAMANSTAGLKEMVKGFDAQKAQDAYDAAYLSGEISNAEHLAGTQGVQEAQAASDATKSGLTDATPYLAGAGAVIDIANGRDAGEAVADAGATLAGSQAGAAAGTAATAALTGAEAGSVVPGIGTAIGAIAGGLLGGGLFKDGGPVGKKGQRFASGGLARNDMTAGGAVNGPGTETSDSIPARLSDGEYVINADSVKAVGKDNLDAINAIGLRKRYGPGKHQDASGAVRMASGGLAALGQGLYRAAPMMMQIDEQRKNDAYRQAQLGLQQSAEARTQGEYDRQNAERDAAKRITEAYAKAFNGLNADSQAVRSGNMSKADYAAKYAQMYTNQLRDGKSLQPLQNGNYAMTEGDGPKASYKEITADDVHGYLDSPEMRVRAYEQMFSDLAGINPAYAQQAYAILNNQMTAAATAREKQADRDVQKEVAAGHDAVAREGHNITSRGQDLSHQVGMANAGAHQASSAASAALHGVQQQSAQLALDNAKEVQAARLAQAEGKPLTPTQKAALAGVQKGDVKVEMNEVATALGTPAVDSNGKPVADVMTGRQVVNRNVAEEQKFFKWMRDNNINDTNQGLAIYLANKGGGGAASTGMPKAGDTRIVNGQTYEWDGNIWNKAAGRAASGAIK